MAGFPVTPSISFHPEVRYALKKYVYTIESMRAAEEHSSAARRLFCLLKISEAMKICTKRIKICIKRILLLLIIWCYELPTQARQVYVGFNSADCAHCLMAMSTLRSLPYFNSYKFVFKQKDKRQALLLLAEFAGVKASAKNALASDSLFKVVSPDGQSCLSVFEDDGTLRARFLLTEFGDATTDAWLRRALPEQSVFKVLAQNILPDTTVLSPATNIGGGLLKGEVVIINYDFNSVRVHYETFAKRARLSYQDAAALA